MLEIREFSKIYSNGKKAVDNISLQVDDGEIFGFIGHNGAGKTTTRKAIVGISKIENGDILIDGISIKEKAKICKEKLAYIPDNPDIYENLTGIQYINFISDIYKIPIKIRKEKIKEIGDLLEITSMLGDVIKSYSHGTKQKLVLLSAFIHQPKLLVLDEPFVGLDPIAAHRVKLLLRRLCDDGGSVFLSTHVLEIAEKLCDKIAILKNGKIIEQGKTQDVLGNETLENLFMELVDNA